MLSGMTSLRAWLIVFALWGFAFALACRLLSMPDQQERHAEGFADKMLGGIRYEIGGGLYEQADAVFHKGITRPPAKKVPDWFAKMRRETAPYGHVHLHKEGILEIMPWLYLATRADPGNVTAYTVAAYWLAGEAGRPDLAEEVLNEALRNNPSDYRIYMEKGRLAMKEGKYKKAARYLDAAYARLPGTNNMDKEQMKIDRAEILVYRGLLYEMEGRPANALRCYRETIQIFPGRLNLKERMIALEKGGPLPTPPEKLAETLLLQHRHVCAEDEDG